MLSVKNLVKVYKAKGGAETRALDGVSIDFPEKGMVFLLGKSGSGKSTLLNVAGGLDVPTSGEIIVKGKSSRDFTPSDFDSFRNTFIGFIFQEYNLLEEFNIEQNIALALQLQGKKSDATEVDKLLELVDLKGFNKRKPNTLSGGQRQRVAIARALIKNPEIIMADEPTGALDSETGEQVFETLKKLSEDKLVIVVSHDREFAEEYADRIIELKDGKILSDITKEYDQSEFKGANVNILGDSTVRIKDCSKLSDEDVSEIIKAIKQKGGGEMIILSDENKLAEVKKVCDIKDEKSGGHFEKTDLEKTKPAIYDGSKTKFIKSKLPASHAIKIGASGLKTKPVRLAFTILLSVISFTLFGVLSAMMLYDPIYSIAVTLQEKGYAATRLEKNAEYMAKSWTEDAFGNRRYDNYNSKEKRQVGFGADEVAKLSSDNKDLDFAGVFGAKGSFADNVQKTSRAPYYTITENKFSGFTDCGEDFLKRNGFTCIAGSYPTKDNEIAISNYVYEIFAELGYKTSDTAFFPSKPQELIGKTLDIRLNMDSMYDEDGAFKITGIYDFGELSAYSDLKRNDLNINVRETIELKNAFEDEVYNGFHSLGFVSNAFYEKYGQNLNNFSKSAYIHELQTKGIAFDDNPTNTQTRFTTPTRINAGTDRLTLYNANGEKETSPITLADNETYAFFYRFSSAFDSLARQSVASRGYYTDVYGNTVTKWSDEKNFESTTPGFYANYDGDISFTYKDGYTFCEYGHGTVTKEGKPFRNISGYYMNMLNDTLIKRSDISDFKYTYVCMYLDGSGNIYSEEPTNITTKEIYGVYIGEESGKIYYSYPEEKSYFRHGFFVNPTTGEPSVTKTSDDMVFTRNYLKNKKTGEIIFAQRYMDSFFDKDGNPVFPTDCGLSDVNKQLGMEDNKYYYQTNGEFRKAYINLVMTHYPRTASYYDFSNEELAAATEFSSDDFKTLVKHVKENNGKFSLGLPSDYFEVVRATSSVGEQATLKIKGYFLRNGCMANYVLTPNFAQKYSDPSESYGNNYGGFDYSTDYTAPADEKYSYVISKSSLTFDEVKYMLEKRGVVSYEIKGNTANNVSNISYSLESFKLVFAIAGGVLAALSALMLFNFISASISAKTRDIGILRAVGGRGADVFKIFFSESSIIAAICFAISAICAGIACYFLNGFFVGSSLHITVLNYGFVEVAFILGISLVVSLLATFIPVYFAAKRSPVESIRSL